MNWKFWQKEKHNENSSGSKEVRLAKPKELPDRVGMHLVTDLKEDPDWVWNLKCALRPQAEKKNVFEIRIFDPATAHSKGVMIKDFNSLDAYADMILFAGTFDKNTNRVQVQKTLKDAA